MCGTPGAAEGPRPQERARPPGRGGDQLRGVDVEPGPGGRYGTIYVRREASETGAAALVWAAFQACWLA